VFGHTLRISTGREIPVRWIAEQHVVEDCGRIPSLSEWLRCIRPEPWMNSPRRLAMELESSASSTPRVAHRLPARKLDPKPACHLEEASTKEKR
jgi:hypothetical protein